MLNESFSMGISLTE